MKFNAEFLHSPVLLKQTVDAVLPNKNLIEYLTKENNNQIYIVDGTIGGAGHAKHLIETFHQHELYQNFFLNFIGIDQDQLAIKAASQKLENLTEMYPRFRYTIFHANFSEINEILRGMDPAVKPRDDRLNPRDDRLKPRDDRLNPLDGKVHGFYADFGVSSPQLDTLARGFSFLQEGPLDMRMNQENSLTAAKILLSYSEADLAQLFFEYGEEPKSRLLARAIVTDRKKSTLPIQNTKVFAEYIKKILKYGYSRTHPATRVFQALRIEVNKELESIQTLLMAIPSILSPGGKAAFISFHSLEDRLVKRTMRLWQEKEMGREKPRGGITPTAEEIAHNSRARSARLRVFDFVG